ncbi:type 2 periplasmic-binding domain-containing protein [Blautia marasmi]|uniref:hypothetical protein n=1 Tax=Blautia marasmi TaxID=1917868 RepID=UPI000CF2BAEF|nr:hypothetical protein [Blautia marasmi]
MKIREMILITLSAGVLLFAGCGAGQKDIAKEEGDPYVTASLFCDVNFWEPPSWSTGEGTITGDITEKTGLALDITVPPQNADAQLSLMLLNDELPDIISLTDETTISQLITSGKVWNLEEFLKKYCPDSHLLKSFPEDIKKELIKRDGGWYAYPSHMNSQDSRKIWKPSSKFFEDWTNYNDNNAVIWNRELLRKAGLTIEDVQTEEQVLAAWEQVKNMHLDVGGEAVIPLLVDGKGYSDPTVKFLEYTFGAERVDENGNYRDILLQPEAKHALLFLNEAIRKGYASPEQLTYENAKIKTLMAKGNVFCFIGNVANSGIDYTEWVSSGPIFSSGGETPVLGKNLRAPTGWLGTFISKDCSHPAQVAAWLDYMSSDDGLLFWSFGYEGSDYHLDDQGYVVQTEKGEKASLDYGQTGQGAWWMFDNFSWERSVLPEPKKGSSAAAEKEIFTAYGSHERTAGYDESLLPLTAEDIPPESEEGILDAKIREYQKEQIPRIILAESREEAEARYTEMTETLNRMGIDSVDAYKNEIYQKNCREYGKSIEKINVTVQ